MQYHPTLSRDLQYPAVAGFRRVLVWGPAGARGSPLVHPDGLQFFLWGTAARAVRLGYNVLALDADTSLHYDVYAWLKVRGWGWGWGGWGARMRARAQLLVGGLWLSGGPAVSWMDLRSDACTAYTGRRKRCPRPSAQAPPYANHTWIWQDEGWPRVNSGVM